jgi:hypothetical protein
MQRTKPFRVCCDRCSDAWYCFIKAAIRAADRRGGTVLMGDRVIYSSVQHGDEEPAGESVCDPVAADDRFNH